MINYLKSLNTRLVVITDSNVARLHGKRFVDLGATLLSFPAGEKYKTRETKAQIEDQLLAAGFGRDTAIIALGGGVVSDLAGFIAATYCRGVPLILVPTTPLAIVDASIGGKNGVNVGDVKNRIGTIYQPSATFIEWGLLETLPQRAWNDGIAETIKHALIGDAELFAQLEAEVDFRELVSASRGVKQRIVAQDPYEKGMRRLLNFGHTLAHVLEPLSNYTLSHGEAVSIGSIFASFLSMEMGFLSETSYLRIRALFEQYQLPLHADFSREKALSLLAYDKKARQGSVRFVLLKEIGAALECEGNYCMSVPHDLLMRALDVVYTEYSSI